MGHQLPRTVVAAAVALVLAGCSGADGDGAPLPVLDVAREQVADAGGAGPEPPTSVDEASIPIELPPPDPSSFTGVHRIVNLFAGEAPAAVDVWARRTFTHGPVQLVENVGFREVSGSFAAPTGHRVVIVSVGAGPDGEERAVLPGAADDEHVTTVFTNADDATDATGATTSAIYESGSDRGPRAPGPGLGLVVLAAPNLSVFDDELIASVGGDEFFVGDGSADCRSQRTAAAGVAADVLAGPVRVELEIEPGPVPISLHPSPSRNGCDQPAAHAIVVDVLAGETTTVLVYTSDGERLETLILDG